MATGATKCMDAHTQKKERNYSWVCWLTPIILALGRQRQEGRKFQYLNFMAGKGAGDLLRCCRGLENMRGGNEKRREVYSRVRKGIWASSFASEDGPGNSTHAPSGVSRLNIKGELRGGRLFIHGCGTMERRNQQDHINQSFTLEEIQGFVELEGRHAEGSGNWFVVG